MHNSSYAYWHIMLVLLLNVCFRVLCWQRFPLQLYRLTHLVYLKWVTQHNNQRNWFFELLLVWQLSPSKSRVIIFTICIYNLSLHYDTLSSFSRWTRPSQYWHCFKQHGLITKLFLSRILCMSILSSVLISHSSLKFLYLLVTYYYDIVCSQILKLLF